MNRQLIAGSIILALAFWAVTGSAADLTDLERLGGLIYRDENLSANQNQSCMTCHHPSAGFADPENLKNPIDFPVSDGSDPTLFGGRNAPTAAYSGFSPVFSGNPVEGYVGGMFWDGRATGLTLGDPLAEQAQGPFTNPVEMALLDDAAVVSAVASAKYVNLFLSVFPYTDFNDVQGTFDNIAHAIAAFERSSAVTRFNSKFDKFWAACRRAGIDVSTIDTTTDPETLPQGILTSLQLTGLALFNDIDKGNCAACHVTTDYVDSAGNVLPPLFTDFTFDNLGIPTNPRVFELAGGAPPDLGLGGRLNEPTEYGKFKVPTLRNVAHTAPYGHNGYFPTLKEVVNFYNTRDVNVWDAPEVPENVNVDELGNLGLTRREELAIVTFLRSLSDAVK